MSMMRVRASREISDPDWQALMAAFGEEADVQEEQSRGFAPDPEWMTFIAVLKDVGAAAGAGASIVRLVNELLTWRTRMRERGEQASIALEAPGRPKLELTSAGDDEVRAWFGAHQPDAPA